MAKQIYIIKCFYKEEQFLKVGFTKYSVRIRYKENMPYRYKTLRVIKSKDAKLVETSLHASLIDFRYKPIRKFIGYTECYPMSQFKHINKLINQCLGIKDKIKNKKPLVVTKERQSDIVDIFGNLNYMNLSNFKE